MFKFHIFLKNKHQYIYYIFTLVAIAIIALFIYPKEEEQSSYLRTTYEQYCGSCHLLPNPSNITKDVWKNSVLPEMAKRMGLNVKLKNQSIIASREKDSCQLKILYQENPLLDSIEWNALRNYIINMAPKNIPNSYKVSKKISKLTQFNTELKKINEKYPAGGIVNLSFDKLNHKLLIGDYYGQLHAWNNSKVKWSIESPLISSIQNVKDLYITGIGIMTPSEVPAGTVYKVDADKITPIVKDLHRPVHVEINDLNENGHKEIIICEFGHLTGELSIYVEKGKNLNKKTLLALPGSICVEIIDMNGDGRKDIVALFSQGREGIYIFYQKENLKFSMEHSIKMGPEYGSSWFSVLDFNKDGYNDIVLTNGDNADYSKFLKPYHGIRLFINDGKNNFQEKWFYPINGATKVLVEDFDLDGDLDFAVSSFFPDSMNHPEKGFIYLENIDSSEFIFNAQVTEMAKNGKWLVMEKGDFDQDGDIDIMLGNFNKIESNAFKTVKNYDLLYLENTQISK